MPTTYYNSVNGRILGEFTDGVETTYMTDALGSTIGTIQNSGVINRYVYKPYGARLAKTGSGPDPRFLWFGGAAFLASKRAYAEQYLEGHYSNVTCNWTSWVPGWPPSSEDSFFGHYTYGHGDPFNLLDAASYLSMFLGNADKPGCPPRCITGPCPKPYRCDRDAAGSTNCDCTSGRVWTVLCWCKCDAPCFDAHEGQHRHDEAACCAAVPNCVLHWHPGCPDCCSAFFKWKEHNFDWLECRAYTSQQFCQQDMWKAQGCKTNPHKPCCVDLARDIKFAAKYIGIYCPNAKHTPCSVPCQNGSK